MDQLLETVLLRVAESTRSDQLPDPDLDVVKPRLDVEEERVPLTGSWPKRIKILRKGYWVGRELFQETDDFLEDEGSNMGHISLARPAERDESGKSICRYNVSASTSSGVERQTPGKGYSKVRSCPTGWGCCG